MRQIEKHLYTLKKVGNTFRRIDNNKVYIAIVESNGREYVRAVQGYMKSEQTILQDIETEFGLPECKLIQLITL